MLHFVRAAWGGEEVEQDVCGLSPSSACAAMQPGPSTVMRMMRKTRAVR